MPLMLLVLRSSTINLTPGTFSSIGIYTKAQQLADIETNFGGSVKAMLRPLWLH